MIITFSNLKIVRPFFGGSLVQLICLSLLSRWNFLLVGRCSLAFACYLLVFVCYSLVFGCFVLRFALCLLGFFRCLLVFVCWLLAFARCSIFFARCLLLFARCLTRNFEGFAFWLYLIHELFISILIKSKQKSSPYKFVNKKFFLRITWKLGKF